MQFSADILPDDHRNFIHVGEPDAEEEDGPEDWADWSTREWILNVSMAVCLFGGGGYVLYRKGLDYWIQHPALTTGCVILFLLFSLSLAVNFEARLGRWRRDYDRLDHTALRDGFNLGEARFDLRPEGLGVTFALVRNLYAWQGFQAFNEGSDAFYLMFTEGDNIIVPKRAFRDEAARERFKDLVATRVGGGK